MYKRRHQKQCPRSIQEVYKRSQKAQTRGGEIETKNITCPYLEPNQSTKVTREKWLNSIDTLTQDQRLHIKEFFNLWSESSSLPDANIFFSIQTVQNIHKGVICQTFLRVFPTKALCHPRRVSFIEQERIQATPKREKRRFHRTRVFAQ